MNRSLARFCARIWNSLKASKSLGKRTMAATALRQIAELKPDLVLLDLHMPVMSGLEVVRRIERGKPMPVIVVVTAHDKYAVQAFEAGAIDYLLKPVGQQRLAEAVERAKRVSGSRGGGNACATSGDSRSGFAARSRRRSSASWRTNTSC